MIRKFMSVTTAFLLVLIGCTSSTKMLQNRQYDMAISRSVKQLAKKPGNIKERNVLAQAYAQASEQDLGRIKFLKQSNEPQVWEEIYQVFDRMKARQSLVATVHPSVKQAINFMPADYDQELIDAKRKAADFLFSEGKALLSRKNRPDARTAYGKFMRVKGYLPSYQGIDDMISQASEAGITRVFFRIQNSSGRSLPAAYEEDLRKAGLQDISGDWVVFSTQPEPRAWYAYTIVLNIRNIAVTPELSARRDTVETRDVEDGWEVTLDAGGNVTKDSLGNEVRRAKYKTLRAQVTKFSLGKSASVGGTLDFTDNGSGQVVKSDPIMAESKFEFVYAVFKGDVEALSQETRHQTTLKITPFPSNEEMVVRTGETLKRAAKEIIYANRGVLQ